ncbi:MAG: carboxypeptidase regulatory-like domain-containing protein, partial [Actinobacteria bacterium]|nr:carboxypeptidase regulatory-like domain-containing protein [Actinomycetota bacterium]NIS34190.1 carboxypeptidase regulatory-like domain-containing protein [Actinomycetota bacterium]NIU68968.1 carboxypeptidase regulatory-like domain-containing protein [Actinomycetota bacterium]NIV89022.1 carboxypeptidase regulatory-like domain-containing protein [Actinomycetota bacterium]NIW30820.1 carboxypeptidase regulatory-like domain-containing protein [Actinomycetota bacterium]
LIDALSRRPVAGGIVWDAKNPLTAAVADRAGGFVMTGPDGKRLEIAAGAPGYMNAHSRQVQLGGTARVGPTLALQPAAVIEGKVVDAAGTPVDGAEV